MEKIENLTGLRAYAALWVVVLHLASTRDFGVFNSFIAKGSWGVWIFFVLSGFVLGLVYRQTFRQHIRLTDYFRFLWLRLARIYPAHIVTFLLVALILMPRGIWPTLQTDTTSSFWMNVTLTHAWGLLGIHNVSYNHPSWTISTEWFAYIFFPFVVFATGWIRSPVLFVLLAAAALGTYYTLLNTVMNYFQYGLAAVGCLLFVIVGYCSFSIAERLPKHRAWHLVALLAAIGIFAVAYYVDKMNMRNVHHVLVPALAGVLIMALYLSGKNFVTGSAIPVYLGEISYSLYLVHMPVMWVVRHDAGGKLNFFIELSATLVAAALLYHLVEVPTRAGMRSLLNWRIVRADDRNSPSTVGTR